jgi:hypothetical protein
VVESRLKGELFVFYCYNVFVAQLGHLVQRPDSNCHFQPFLEQLCLGLILIKSQREEFVGRSGVLSLETSRPQVFGVQIFSVSIVWLALCFLIVLVASRWLHIEVSFVK